MDTGLRRYDGCLFTPPNTQKKIKNTVIPVLDTGTQVIFPYYTFVIPVLVLKKKTTLSSRGLTAGPRCMHIKYKACAGMTGTLNIIWKLKNHVIPVLLSRRSEAQTDDTGTQVVTTYPLCALHAHNLGSGV